jgi:hypothetical protein
MRELKNFQLKRVCKIQKGKRTTLAINLKQEKLHNLAVTLVDTRTQQRIKI